MSGNFSGGSFSDAIGGFSVDPVPVSAIPIGGSGYPVYRKREAKSASNSIDMLWDLVASEYYAELVDSDAAQTVKKQAAAIVKPYTDKKAAVPKAKDVNWAALKKDAERVAALLALWQEQVLAGEIADDDEDILLMMGV